MIYGFAVYFVIEIECGPAKDEANIAKHGVSLILGATVLESLVGEAVDARRYYGETRINAFGFVEGRLFVCTYTMRGGTYRIISVRKAGKQEKRIWLS